jgi:hypothetical protein
MGCPLNLYVGYTNYSASPKQSIIKSTGVFAERVWEPDDDRGTNV